MNRIQALENDLRRTTDRLGKRTRRTGLPAPTTPPRDTAGGGATQQATASALSTWRGSRPAARPPRQRTRAMSMLDYRVPDLPMPLQQASSALCWATVATMMASWRDRQSWTVEAYVGGLGAPWAAKLAANEGLYASEVPQLLATMGLQVESTQANFTSERWESMLREWGPLWVTADFDPSPGEQGVHAHILVGIHGPSDGNPTVDLIDPWVGREVSMPMTDFVAKYEQLANTRFAGLQIRHWPARAQQAAQLSLAWARQEVERVRQQSAEAVVAGAGLLYSVFKDAMTTRGLSWKRSELKGKVVPGNIDANKPLADAAPYKGSSFLSKKTRTWDDIVVDDNVGAEFMVEYEYNGTCLANVRMNLHSFAPPRMFSGRDVSVDSDITQAFSYERDNVAAVQITFVYSFSYGRGSAGTFTQKYVVFGDGRAPLFSETQA